MTRQESDDLAARVRELQVALDHQRAVADAERRRADLLERSAAAAWRLSIWANRTPRANQGE